jgi:glutamate racemase
MANRESSFVNRSSRNRPIGVFDSGLGGLTVVKALKKVLPYEEIVYLGDTARLPYGTKSAEAIQRFSIQDIEFLIGRNVKLVIVACHSASSVALDELLKRYPLPILGVIDPGARAAVDATRNNRIGVIGTNLTIGSGSYERAIRHYRRDVEIIAKATPLFVPLAEEGWLTNDVAFRAANAYLQPFKTERIDTLLLGCTHYPLLKKVIARVLGKRITLVDSSEETARSARALLEQQGLIRRPRKSEIRHPKADMVRFYLSDLTPNFREVCGRFLGAPVGEVIRASIPE